MYFRPVRVVPRRASSSSWPGKTFRHMQTRNKGLGWHCQEGPPTGAETTGALDAAKLLFAAVVDVVLSDECSRRRKV